MSPLSSSTEKNANLCRAKGARGSSSEAKELEYWRDTVLDFNSKLTKLRGSFEQISESGMSEAVLLKKAAAQGTMVLYHKAWSNKSSRVFVLGGIPRDLGQAYENLKEALDSFLATFDPEGVFDEGSAEEEFRTLLDETEKSWQTLVERSRLQKVAVEKQGISGKEVPRPEELFLCLDPSAKSALCLGKWSSSASSGDLDRGPIMRNLSKADFSSPQSWGSYTARLIAAGSFQKGSYETYLNAVRHSIEILLAATDALSELRGLTSRDTADALSTTRQTSAVENVQAASSIAMSETRPLVSQSFGITIPNASKGKKGPRKGGKLFYLRPSETCQIKVIEPASAHELASALAEIASRDGSEFDIESMITTISLLADILKVEWREVSSNLSALRSAESAG